MTTPGMTEDIDQILSERAMLVALHVTGWSGRKLDKDVGADVASRANAVGEPKEIGSYSKRLVVGAAITEVSKLGSAIRKIHYMYTMPWDDTGVRLLPVTTYDRYVQYIDELVSRRHEAREEFLAAYPTYVNEARTRLGTLFNEGDYPTSEELREKIGAEYNFSPLPKAEHFVVSGLMAEQAQKIRESIIEQTEAKLVGTVTNLWNRLASAIENMHEKLEPDAEGNYRVFQESSLTHLREVAALIPDLNISGDENLNLLASEVDLLLDGVEVNSLRPKNSAYDEDTHTKVRDGIADMSAALKGYFG